ncbi:molybdopterin molybdotransferase MoeA [Flavobacteriaceae bacterium M23B6Z8]
MISYQDAYDRVLQNTMQPQKETVSLKKANLRILAENIVADRDFPPFDRSTKDGVVFDYQAVMNGDRTLKIAGIISAGMPSKNLPDKNSAFEIMTGAVVPENGDTVIMYEELTFSDGHVVLPEHIKKGHNIHYQGSDLKKGDLLLEEPKVITAAEIGILASVGKAKVEVYRLPKIAVLSTGNELVDIEKEPAPYQIRKSNSLSLVAALEKLKIRAKIIHLKDEKNSIERELKKALNEYDVLLISGGVSKGKFDFLPEALESSGVLKIFHRVLQRPGKPFWFGKHPSLNTTVFSFPGNPVSTFANYHIYFLPWFQKSFGLKVRIRDVFLDETLEAHPELTRFFPVKIALEKGKLLAKKVHQNGSGDLTSLTHINGFVRLAPQNEAYRKGALVPFTPTNFNFG